MLTNFNLTVPKGTKLGIVGESGSGKSTLINLLFRFHDPDAGAIKLDGHDLRDLSIPDFVADGFGQSGDCAVRPDCG